MALNSEQLPAVLAPFLPTTEPVEYCTTDLNTALSALVDSDTPLSTQYTFYPIIDSQRGLHSSYCCKGGYVFGVLESRIPEEPLAPFS